MDELEALYLRYLKQACATAVTSSTKRYGVHLHVASREYDCSGDRAVRLAQQVMDSLTVQLSRDGHAYAVPSEVSVYSELPASPAGKILYGDMVLVAPHVAR